MSGSRSKFRLLTIIRLKFVQIILYVYLILIIILIILLLLNIILLKDLRILIMSTLWSIHIKALLLLICCKTYIHILRSIIRIKNLINCYNNIKI